VKPCEVFVTVLLGRVRAIEYLAARAWEDPRYERFLRHALRGLAEELLSSIDTVVACIEGGRRR